MTPVVQARGLTKSYGSRRGVVELDFAVEQGEVFGYLGPNGAGKTTTIRLMLDLHPADGRSCRGVRDRTSGADASRCGGDSATSRAMLGSTSG